MPPLWPARPPSPNTQHPDKCQDDPEATAKFQALSVVHATLSDPEKRRLYDETGEVEEEGGEELSKSEQEWYDYFRALFPKVRGRACPLVGYFGFADGIGDRRQAGACLARSPPLLHLHIPHEPPQHR